MFGRLFVLVALLCYTLPVHAQSVDEIIAKYVAARGGLDRIKAVNTELVTGTISFGPGAEGPFIIERKRPLKLRMEITLNGQTLVRVYDGKSTGWIYNPFKQNPTVELMSESDLHNIFDEADFDGPFVDYQAKGNKIESMGEQDVLFKPAYKLKLTNKNGEVSFFYLDVATMLLIKWEGTRTVNGKEVPWESFFSDFREVGGLKHPFLVESTASGSEQRQTISTEKMEMNVPLDDKLFEKPNPPVPDGATAPTSQSAKP